MSKPFITSYRITTLRNDFDGWVGFKFTMGPSDQVVTDVGRWHVAANTATHEVGLYRADSSLIVSATVDVSSGSAAPFNWARIPPTPLLANTVYFIASRELNAGDQWYEIGAGEEASYLPIATINLAAYSADPIVTFSTQPTANALYVPVNFMISPGASLQPLLRPRPFKPGLAR